MWKKFIVVLLSLVGTFSVVYAMNGDMSAALTLSKGTKFKMGGIEWQVVDQDATTKQYYIFSSDSIVKEYCNSVGHNGTKFVLSGNTNKCLTSANITYSKNLLDSALNDAIAKTILSDPILVSQVQTLALIDYNDPWLTSGNSSGLNDSWLAPAGSSYTFYNGSILNMPSNSSQIIPFFKLGIPLVKDLQVSYNPAPQNSLSNYEYSKNVSEGEKVGEVIYQDGAGTPTLSIVAHPTAPSGHANDYMNFELNTAPTSSPVDVIIKSTNAPDIVNGSLKAGDYYFRVMGVDANGNPDPAPYQDVKLTVDKTTATLSFNDTTTKNMKIGDSTFTDSMTTSNTDTLKTGDMTYSLSGGITGALTATPYASNPLSYDLKVPATFGAGLPANFTLSATLGETDNFLQVSTTTNRTINVTKGIGSLAFTAKKSSFLPSEVGSANTTIGSMKVSDGIGPFTYELVSTSDPNYNATTGADNASFTISNTPTALGSALDVKTISALTTLKTYNLQFKVTDTNTTETAYATGTIVVGLNAQADLKFKDVPNGIDITTTGKKIKFDNKSAMLLAEGGSSGVAIEYTALPQAQQPSGIDPDTIATIDKATGVISPAHVGTIKVKAKRPGNATYSDIETTMNLTIEPAEQLLVFNNTTSPTKVALGKTILEDATATLKSTGTTGVGTITYTSSNPSVASVDASGNVTGNAVGNATLTVTLNDKSGAGYDPNYEDVTITKAIQVFKGMNVTWTAKTPNIKAESNAVSDQVGMISVSDIQGNISFKISGSSTPQNVNKDFFKIVTTAGSTTAQLQLDKQITAAEWVKYTGVFKVQVDVTDDNGTQTLDITITVDEADNDAYFTDNNGSKITSLSKVFGENGNTFQLTSASTNTGSVTYSLDPSDTSGTFSKVTGTGVVTIDKAGIGVVRAVVSSGSGYAGITITMNVTVTQGTQNIAFKDTTTLSRSFVLNSTFNEPADLKETSLNTISTRSINYVSNSPTICSINPTTGQVTMLSQGICDIDAKNTDTDWQTVTTNKRINLYDKMAVIWTEKTPRLKAESNAIGDVVGTLSVTANQGAPIYKIATATTSANVDASFFKLATNGLTADLQLAKQISAADWMSHSGKFKVQIEVQDTFGKETIDVIVNIDAADNNIYFTDSNGLKITSLSKVYGENGNTFNLTSSSSNAGIATYSVAPSDTNGVLMVYPNGSVAINKEGTATVQVDVAPGIGYVGGSVTMNVTVSKGTQNIAFQDTTTLSRSFVLNSTFNELADLKETSLNTLSTRSITYVSNSPTICSIDSTIGQVTMLAIGTCDIDAKNTDMNWSSATTNKRIMLYDKMTISFTPTTPNLKAEANAIGDITGVIKVAGNQSAPVYKIATNTTSNNADASYFEVIGSGTTADLKLKTPISATDRNNHNGKFKVQVEVTDVNGTETIDIIVDVDEADNDIYFTDGGSKVTSLSKKYGENGNTFNLTSTSTSGGSVTYDVDASDTTGTLTVLPSGAVTINKVGIGTVKAVVVASGGYVGGTITMNVTVTPGDQSIAFKDTTTLNRQFVSGATFDESAILKETSKNTTSTRAIDYVSNDTSVCTVDPLNGTVTMIAKGTCDITASNKDSNWTAVTTNKKINLYDGMGVSYVPMANLQAESVSTSSGSKAGDLNVVGGMDPKTYAISTTIDPKNKDASLFQINSTGIISFKKAIQASDLKGKHNPTTKVYELYVQLETVDSAGTKVTTDAIVEVKGAPLGAQFDNVVNGKITEVYGTGKTFILSLLSNKGNGVPTYQLKVDASMPQDVLQSVDASGLVTIEHANDPAFVGNPLMVEAVIPASDGYDEETIEVEVEITKAPQPNFAFKTPNIKLGHGASITPTFTGNLSKGSITMNSPKPKSVKVSGSDLIAGTTDDVVTITADDSGDRDYQDAIAQATVTISSAPAYSLIVSVPSATYGDTGLMATAKAVGSIGTNPTLAWSSSDPTIADIDASGNITILKAGSVTITCTRITTGEPSVTATATLDIDPKPITVTINDASKYVGEAVPTFSAVIPTSDLVGSDTLGQPTFSCKDGASLVKPETKAGKYDINGSYPTASYPNYAITVKKGTLTVKQDASLPSWFHLEGATSKITLDGTKWVNEDVNVVLDSAIESAGTYDEISLDNTLWGTTHTINKEGNISSNVQFRINASKILATPQTTSVKIDKTKPVITKITGTKVNDNGVAKLVNSVSFGLFFKPGVEVVMESSDANKDASIQTSGIASIEYKAYVKQNDSFVEIDKGKATLKGTTGKVILSDPGVYRVCAIAKDNAGNASSEYCSELDVKKIGIDVDGDGGKDFLDPDNDGCPDINIVLKNEKDEFYKLNVDRNNDNLPDLNIDSDGDGIAEINVDTDDDGKPDINLLALSEWKPTLCVTDQSEQYCTMPNLEPKINISSKMNDIADLNIDIDGDMITDINIDQNNNKKLDVDDYNITSSMDVWEPKKDFEVDTFVYDTQVDLKAYVNIVVKGTDYPSINLDTNGDGTPDLNIDIDLDGLPDVEIDGDGDGIADINLDPKGTGTPQENILKITTWLPEVTFTNGPNTYLTMKLKGSNELEDNGIKIEKPSGGTFLPNFALKTEDITKTISNQDREKIESILGEKEEVKQIFNVSLFKDDTSIQPDGTIRVKIPVINGLKNPKLVITQKDGTQKVVDAVEENGYYIYETDYLSMVSVIGDKELVDPIPDENPITKPSDKDDGTSSNKGNNVQTPNTSVKGEYTNGTGGAMTGDETNVIFYLVIGIGMLNVMCYIRKKAKNQD